MDSKTTPYMVNTGAAVSLMHKDIWDKVNTGNQERELEAWAEQQLMSFDGNPL